MTNNTSNQKKNIVMNYVYATLIGLLVVACAVTIALVSNSGVNHNENIGGEIPTGVTTFVSPMQGATIVKDYSGSELQYNDTLKQWEIHKAIDFKAGENLDVFAVTDGTVSKVYTNYLDGGVVEITHANGLVSVYMSLADITVNVGDKVSAGAKIGNASEAMAQELNTGAHLHFEMLENGKKVDPNNYLSLGDK